MDPMAVGVAVAVLEEPERRALRQAREALARAGEVVGVMQLADLHADEVVGLVAEHALPARVDLDDPGLGVGHHEQVEAQLEQLGGPGLRKVPHSSSPARIADATAAARSDTPSFS